MKVKKFSNPEEKEKDQEIYQGTISFIAKSDIESLLRNSSVTSEISKLLSSKNIEVGPITFNLKRFPAQDIKPPNEKRHPLAPKIKGRSLKKDYDEVIVVEEDL